jgi:hypothetical protein
VDLEQLLLEVEPGINSDDDGDNSELSEDESESEDQWLHFFGGICEKCSYKFNT